MENRSLASESRLDARLLGVSLVVLACLAMGLVLRNEWVQDDNGVIVHNTLVQSVSGIWRAFGAPYWPPREDQRELYRPLIIAFFTLQWWVGHGATWIFRVVNLAAYCASVLAVWAFLRRLFPERAAWLGAAIFAVHPVHVEAVAVSVNQSETIAATLMLIACSAYLDWRRGAIDLRRAARTIIVCYLPALFIKEHALILPGLFFALELTVLRPFPYRERLKEIVGLDLALLVLGGLFWMIRRQVLGGGAGTTPQEVLVGLNALGRAITMLGIVPEWIRLLVWPAHLQMEWSPLEYVGYTAWSLRETLGVIGLASLGLALVLSLGRRPNITLALLWLGAALLPVANIVMPTGIILAERTLFLASVGVAIVVADLATAAIARGWLDHGGRRLALGGGLALLLTTGAVACASRMVTWQNRVLFLSSAVKDAPLSYRTHISWGALLNELGDTTQGNTELRRAIELHSFGLGALMAAARDLQRESGDCISVTTIYQYVLGVLPSRSDVRVGYVACSAWLGRYAEAAHVARDGIALGIDADYFRRSLAVVDSAATHHAAPMTVRIPALPGGWAQIGGDTLAAGDPR